MITKEEVEINMRGCDLMSKLFVEKLLQERDEALQYGERWKKAALSALLAIKTSSYHGQLSAEKEIEKLEREVKSNQPE